MTNNYDKSGVLGGNYDTCAMDFEAAHQALLAEVRNAGYREGFEAGRAYECSLTEGESYEKELSKLAKYASVMGETTSNITRESEASEALNETYRSRPIESAIKETREFNQQALRDEIVEQAKFDYVNTVHDYQLSADIVEIVVNREKRTVVALIKGSSTGRVLSRGIAKCSPNDCFNVHIGMIIALLRALNVEVPEKYLNAPQPTEVRVGDVIGYEDCRNEVVRVSRSGSHIYVDSGALYLLDDLLDESDDFNPFRDPRIIDDSREEVSE